MNSPSFIITKHGKVNLLSKVFLPRIPDMKWILKYGYYMEGTERRNGYYLEALTSGECISLTPDDISNIVQLDGDRGTPRVIDPEFVYLDNKIDQNSERISALEEIEKAPYRSLDRLRSFAYRVTFDEIPDEKIIDIPHAEGGCSSYVQDGKLHRNLDWNYDMGIAFNVVCNGFEGMAYLSGLTEGNLNNELIGQLPYHMKDGRNDDGIMVSTHVLFNDWEWEGQGNVPLSKLPYLILTNIHSMDNFEEDIISLLDNLYPHKAISDHNYLTQFVVTDGDTTYVISPPESSTGSYVARNATSNPKLTNFRWVSDAEVDRHDLSQSRPVGVERWNMMPCEMNRLKYTNTYENPNWLSEFIGENGTTKDSTDEELEAIYQVAHQLYENRERDGLTWHTFYSVVYSKHGLEELYVQEDFDNNLACKGYSYWTGGEGQNSIKLANMPCSASGDFSIAQGPSSSARGDFSYVEGTQNIAAGDYSHAEGLGTYAEGPNSHTEGNGTFTSENAGYAHAEGLETIADNVAEHAEGRFNVSHHAGTSQSNPGNTISSIGVGLNIRERKNAFEVMENGDIYMLGVGEYDGTNPNQSDSVQDVINDLEVEYTSGDGISIDNRVISINSETLEKIDSALDGLESKQDKIDSNTDLIAKTITLGTDTLSSETLSKLIDVLDVLQIV